MMQRISFGNQVHFISLGCARNLVDSEVMIGLLLKAGYEVSPSLEKADFLVVNTCGFLKASRDEGIQVIQECFDLKKKKAKVIVAGCMVQKESAALKELFPEIHYFIGSGDVEKILEACSSTEQGQTISAKSFLEWGEVPRTLSTPKHYAYLKIAEGCRKRCSFCIIPTIKGPLQSKSPQQVVKEFHALLNQGVMEVILIAQDLGDFGKDRREKGALSALLQKMLETPRAFWLRLLYLYPDEIDADLISVIQSDPRICRYLDMPIQHISDRILKAMRRKTSKQEILSILENLRSQIPDIVIRTSLMVGFPGETEEEFQELCDFVRQAKLDHIGIFRFSAEKEADAAKLPNPVPEKEKRRREKILAKVQYQTLQKKLKNRIGKKVTAIVENVHPDSPLLLTARSQGQCPDIDGQILINDTEKVERLGAFYEVEITDVLGYDLVAKIVKPLYIEDVELPKRPKFKIFS